MLIPYEKKIKEIFSKFKINTVYIFGSYYDGTFSQKSDLDLAYLTSRNEIVDFGSLYIELKEVIPIELDLIDIKKTSVSFAFNIIQNSRILYEQDSEFRTDFEDAIIKKYLDFSIFRNIMAMEISTRIKEGVTK